MGTVERDVIVQEYELSDGGVEREWIEGALDGIGDVEAYFDRVDLPALRRKLLGSWCLIRRCGGSPATPRAR